VVVGIGPGGKLDRTHRAEQAIRRSQVIVGYRPYLEKIGDLLRDQEVLAFGMRQEVRRCEAALDRASAGAKVAIVSSGDAGVYGMAGLALEISASRGSDLLIEIVPGVTAANAAAARLGAPLMLDYACVSLSDLLVPWETVLVRVEAVARADLVLCLYNPRSRKRVRQLDEVAALLLDHRDGQTPVGIATALGSSDERIELSTLESFLRCDIDMRSVVIVGNRTTLRLGPWLVTPRGYAK